jgi:hypothetical protein
MHQFNISNKANEYDIIKLLYYKMHSVLQCFKMLLRQHGRRFEVQP